MPAHPVTIETICADILASGVRLGDYQRELLRGERRWSGGDLRGRAAKWGLGYRRSRDRVAELILAEAARQGVVVEWVGGTSTTGPVRPMVVGRR